MPRSNIWTRPSDNPKTSLLLLFVCWKTLLISIAFLSPGPGYDTSTSLLGTAEKPTFDLYGHKLQPLTSTERLLSKLCRWDAIYFTEIARRGHLYEQEWAFGWGFTRLLSFVAKKLSPQLSPVAAAIFAGVVVSHLSHLLSVSVLYQLVYAIAPEPHQTRLAFLAASLHVISPAGIFLSAPYGESLFSFLNFLGMLLYCKSNPLSSHARNERTRRSVYLLGAGACFGLATTVRSNGLLSAWIFAYDLVAAVPRLPQVMSNFAEVQRLLVTTAAGCLVAAGMILPQWIAYEQYCANHSTGHKRPWCHKLPPSIYSWVQDHYWNVGFLRYWTLSNLPLFLLASPMLYLMLTSSLWALQGHITNPNSGKRSKAKIPSENQPEKSSAQKLSFNHYLRRLAIPQLLLTLLAITNFHVQIITRISSAYPVLYIWLADSLLQDDDPQFKKQTYKLPVKWIIRWMVMYAALQCGLFASFLPPA